MQRNYSRLDTVIKHVDLALITLVVKPRFHARPSPAEAEAQPTLSDTEQRHAAGLMRINHVGEVCAQALYQGQSITARSKDITKKMQSAAAEELDHLAWCMDRLHALNSHPSRLNFLWYSGSLCLGILAGIAGDKYSLGFLAETEQQVVEHLENHFEKLPVADKKSHAVIKQMHQDEAKHRDMAKTEGAYDLPNLCKKAMRLAAKGMMKVAYKI